MSLEVLITICCDLACVVFKVKSEQQKSEAEDYNTHMRVISTGIASNLQLALYYHDLSGSPTIP